MVVVEKGLKSEGLFERGNEWYVQWVKPDAGALATAEFNGVLADWKRKLIQPSANVSAPRKATDLTVAERLGSMNPAQLWSALGVAAALLTGAFALGGKIFGV